LAAERPCRTVRTLGKNGRPGKFRKPPRQRRMIAVGMGDENVADGLPARRLKQGLKMRLVLGPGIDDGERALTADDVGVRAVKGEWARVVRGDPPYARRHLDGRAVLRFEAFVEIERHGQ